MIFRFLCLTLFSIWHIQSGEAKANMFVYKAPTDPVRVNYTCDSGAYFKEMYFENANNSIKVAISAKDKTLDLDKLKTVSLSPWQLFFWDLTLSGEKGQYPENIEALTLNVQTEKDIKFSFALDEANSESKPAKLKFRVSAPSKKKIKIGTHEVVQFTSRKDLNGSISPLYTKVTMATKMGIPVAYTLNWENEFTHCELSKIVVLKTSQKN